MIRKTGNEYNKNKINEKQNDARCLWNNIIEIFGDNLSSEIKCMKNEKGELVCNMNKIVDIFNYTYVYSGINLVKL